MIQGQYDGVNIIVFLFNKLTDLNILLKFIQLVPIYAENLSSEGIFQISNALSTVKANFNETRLFIKYSQLYAISKLKDGAQLQARISFALKFVNFLQLIQNAFIN